MRQSSGLWMLAVLASVLDGVSTYIGIEYAGLSEANPLIVHLMGAIGLIPAMVVVKSIVLTIGLVLFVWVDHRPWMIPLAILCANGLIVIVNALTILSAV